LQSSSSTVPTANDINPGNARIPSASPENDSPSVYHAADSPTRRLADSHRAYAHGHDLGSTGFPPDGLECQKERPEPDEGTQRIEEHDVRKLLQQSTNTGDPIMQTFIDRYIEQGMQQGMQQGVQQGGAAMLLRLIERRFGPPSDQVRERVTRADPNTLLQWSDRILDANSLDEVLH
jgi:hypothetical protein